MRSCMRRSTLSAFVLGQEWLKERVSTIGAPRGLVDLAAWRISLGGHAESDSDASDDD